MGHHRHVRICVNFKKKRSCGALSRDWIYEQIENQGRSFNAPAFGIDGFFDPDPIPAGEVKNVTFIFIKSHNCRHYRTIEKIVSFKCKNGIVVDMCKVTPRLKYSLDGKFYPVVTTRNDPLYRTDINKFDLFKMLSNMSDITKGTLVPAGYHYVPDEE